jgi:hypothetical protein
MEKYRQLQYSPEHKAAPNVGQLPLSLWDTREKTENVQNARKIFTKKNTCSYATTQPT